MTILDLLERIGTHMMYPGSATHGEVKDLLPARYVLIYLFTSHHRWRVSRELWGMKVT
jgi:hypothetical protein